MATGTLAPDAKFTGLDTNGNPLAGGKLTTYLAGTSTLAATYTDVNLTVPNANPVVLDSAGRATLFLTPGTSYKFALTDSVGASIWTQDNVQGVPSGSSNLDVTGTAGAAIAAGNAVYLSDGSGSSKNAGQWYPADSTNGYSSVTPEVGMAPAAILSGATGTIRLSGQVTGLSSLTVGQPYFVSTAGAITLTAPTNRRQLGVADSTSSLILTPNPAPLYVDPSVTCGRLTLTSGTAVTTADVTGATTLYFTPYQGNQISLYSGSIWQQFTFSELSIAVPATTTTMYDAFVYSNAGTPTLELLAWTNDTTRATALVLQDGVYVKTGATTRKYVGSIRTTGVSGQTEDSVLKRFVWNQAKRLRRTLRVVDTTNTWSYDTATIRQANNSTANQVDVVVGLAEVVASLTVQGAASCAASSGAPGVFIGEDSTTAPAASLIRGQTGGTTVVLQSQAFLTTYPAVGRHYYAWLEQGSGSGGTTWYGDNGGTTYQSGLAGWIEG